MLESLNLAYDGKATPSSVFDAITALLSATSYTRRFAADLEEIFAHIPFPATQDIFEAATEIGSQIRALETFGRAPADAFRIARLTGRGTGVTLEIAPIGEAFIQDGTGRGHIALLGDQSLRLSGVSARAFDFQVSGYRLLYRWLHARRGQAIDASLQREAIDLAWRLEELLHWFDRADPVLAQALDRPLTRAQLGLPLRAGAASV